MLSEGMEAYKFELPDKDGNIIKSEDFKGKKIVVYFYPKDNTPGCTRQACAFRNNFSKFNEMGVTVIGISKDSEKSHTKFVDNYSLPFILLSDKDLEAIKGFGVWEEKKLYGKKYMGVSRTTFVIDENGIIEKVFKNVKPDVNAQEVLEYLQK